MLAKKKTPSWYHILLIGTILVLFLDIIYTSQSGVRNNILPPNQVYGLILEVFGAYLFGKGILRGSREIALESLSGLRLRKNLWASGSPVGLTSIDPAEDRDQLQELREDENSQPIPSAGGEVANSGLVYSPTLRSSMARNAIDGLWGAILLITGFLIQIGTILGDWILTHPFLYLQLLVWS